VKQREREAGTDRREFRRVPSLSEHRIVEYEVSMRKLKIIQKLTYAGVSILYIAYFENNINIMVGIICELFLNGVI